jgi:membrane dipeptidase
VSVTASEDAGHPDSSATELHQSSLVIDVHSDVHLDLIRSRAAGETRVLERRHLPGWRAGGVDGLVLNTIPKFGPDPYPYQTSPVQNLLYMLDCLHMELEESAEHMTLVLEPGDFERARSAGKIGIMVGCEGAEPLGSDLSLFRSYHRLGLRVLTLTWHHRNAVGDGVSEPSGSGLSNFGREVVAEANRLGVMLDLSHAGARTLVDVLSQSAAPVVASHSNASRLCEHERNLDDDEIRAIAEVGGLVGVAFLGRFVSATDPDIEDVLDHIDHIAGLVGPEHIGLGPDFTTGGADLIIGSRAVAGPNQPVNDVSIPYARGLETYEEFPAITEGLLRRGHSPESIRGILGANYTRVFEAVTDNAG